MISTLLKIAWRSIWRNKRRTIISIISISFGLAIPIFSISLANGTYHQLIEDSVRTMAGHITVQNKEYLDAPSIDLYVNNTDSLRGEIEKIHGVEKTKSLIHGQGVAKSSKGTIGIGFIGIEPSLEVNTSPLAEKMSEGEFLEDSDEALVVIGSVLAKKLDLAIGKKMVISTNEVGGDLVEELCRVKGIFTTGSNETDGYLVLMPIKFARKISGIPDGASTQLGVILKYPEKLKAYQSKVEEIVKDDSLGVFTWKEVMPDLAAFIHLDYTSGIVFYAIIMILALFTIFNTILMSVIERKREFGVLLAIGTSPAFLQYQVLFETIYLAFIGCGMGALIGSGFSRYYEIHGIDFSSMMGEKMSISGTMMEMVVYNHLTPPIIYGCTIIVFLATILLSIPPMMRASKTPYRDILR